MDNRVVITIPIDNTFIDTIKSSVPNVHHFMEIFTDKTLLDIIGEALELHFNNELDEWELSQLTEELLLHFSSELFHISFSYVPYHRLLVMDKSNIIILDFNLTQFIHKVYWQIQLLVQNHLIPLLHLQNHERISIEKGTIATDNSELRFVMLITQTPHYGGVHAKTHIDVSGFY